jgi:hypothetical protein
VAAGDFSRKNSWYIYYDFVDIYYMISLSMCWIDVYQLYHQFVVLWKTV